MNVVFERIYQFLQNGKHLQRYERLDKNLVICLDGTDYHSSSKISCECCSTRNHRNGKVTYSHTAILPIIAAPNSAEVISLPPEFVTPQDGHEKQDCEAEVVESGRCRWKTEHENHNVLKTKGYNLEHNFGHGEKHLSSTLLSLNLLAFLFHTVLQLIDSSYQEIRRKSGTRRGFFQDILSLTKYFFCNCSS